MPPPRPTRATRGPPAAAPGAIRPAPRPPVPRRQKMRHMTNTSGEIEELRHQQRGQDEPVPARRMLLADHDLVQRGEEERRDDEDRDGDVAERQRRDDGRRVAVDQRGGDGAGLPGDEGTHGGEAAPRAEPGARVSATLVATIGPKAHVTGASTTPTSVPEVFESRLAPSGTLTAPEKKRLCRCAMAQAGHAMNQTSWAGSPQPQVSDAEGCPVQTSHHRTMAGTVNADEDQDVEAGGAQRTNDGSHPGQVLRGRRERRLPGVAAVRRGGEWGGHPRVVGRGGRHVRPARHCGRAYSRAPPRRRANDRIKQVTPRSYDRRRARRAPLRRGRRRAAGPVRRLGAVAPGLAGDRPRGRRRRGPPARGFQGRRPHLPVGLSRRLPRGTGGPGPQPLARPGGGDRATPALRVRAGDLRRRRCARRDRRVAGSRRRARRAAFVTGGGQALPRGGRHRARALRARVGIPGGRRLPARAVRGRGVSSSVPRPR